MQAYHSNNSDNSYGGLGGPDGSSDVACTGGINLADGPKIQDEKKPAGGLMFACTAGCSLKGAGECDSDAPTT